MKKPLTKTQFARIIMDEALEYISTETTGLKFALAAVLTKHGLSDLGAVKLTYAVVDGHPLASGVMTLEPLDGHKLAAIACGLVGDVVWLDGEICDA